MNNYKSILFACVVGVLCQAEAMVRSWSQSMWSPLSSRAQSPMTPVEQTSAPIDNPEQVTRGTLDFFPPRYIYQEARAVTGKARELEQARRLLIQASKGAFYSADQEVWAYVAMLKREVGRLQKECEQSMVPLVKR